MSSGCFRPFGLHEDIPEAALDPEWRALVSQQACTLAGMLQRLQTAVAEGQRRTDALRLQALAAAAEQLLTAQEHVNLERLLVERIVLCWLHLYSAEGLRLQM